MSSLFNLLFGFMSFKTMAADEPGNGGSMWLLLILIGAVFVVMIFVMPMMRRKKQTQFVDMLHNGIRVGCTVKTLGGLVGRVVAINESSPLDKEVVLETGTESSKSTLTFDINYIYTVLTNPDGTKYVMSGLNRKAGSTASVGVQVDNPQPFADDVKADDIKEVQAEIVKDQEFEKPE